MVAEDLLGANQPGEAGGGVVDGGGELELLVQVLDIGEGFNEALEDAAH